MLNDRITAARSVAEHLLPHEREIDDAVIRNARLTIALVEARQKARAPLPLGQEALRHVSNAAVCLADARSHINDAHMVLRDAQLELGIPNMTYGDYGATAAAPDTYQPTPLKTVA